MTSQVRFSPLALAQLDSIWDYGFEKFGLAMADTYIDGLFSALNELTSTSKSQGLPPKQVPIDNISDICKEPIYFIPYSNEILYLKKINSDQYGVVCILGNRMDTPNRLKEMLSNRFSDIK